MEPAAEVPFSSAWKWSGATLDGCGPRTSYVLGAPDVLKRAGALALTPSLERALAQHTGAGRRVVAFGETPGTLPDDPLLHACVAAYASDMTLLDSVLLAHGVSWQNPKLVGASLDHAMWFHRPFRADEWFLYQQESPIATGGRGLARGQIFNRDGELLVSVMQEGLFRKIGG